MNMSINIEKLFAPKLQKIVNCELNGILNKKIISLAGHPSFDIRNDFEHQ